MTKSQLGPGQARCWLGHLNIMREISLHGWTTTLVVEDDTDWDVNIKRQMKLVAPLIREISSSANANGAAVDTPYGNNWDLLWLGHCGDKIAKNVTTAAVHDPSLPDASLYRGAYGTYSYFPPHLRLAHISYWPLCTYAYAVTQEAALKIYRHAVGGEEDIITVVLRNMCHSGTLRCVTVNPELFHHHKQKGQEGSQIAKAEGWRKLGKIQDVSYTPNIRYSARCNSRARSTTSVAISCRDENGVKEDPQG
jgi:hypothetical protein